MNNYLLFYFLDEHVKKDNNLHNNNKTLELKVFPLNPVLRGILG